MTTESDGQRLLRLRQRLGLTQRELASELKVSPGAIALWENLSRPVPGPVVKLIELYEGYIDGDDEAARRREIREVSGSWTKMLLRGLGVKKKDPALLSSLEQQIERTLNRELSNESWKRSIQLNLAGRIVRSLGGTKGLPMKLAQLASYIDLGLPQDLRDMLATLQSLSTPMHPTVAARVFHEEIGRSPQEAFKSWEPRPFAAASIGQVHKAVLHTGEEVAVKIQYPGIQEALALDFSRLETFQSLASLFQSRDPEVLHQLKTHVLNECDYMREAHYQERFRQYFEGHPGIKIPKVHLNLTRQRVLTQELVQGKSYQEFLATCSEAERQKAAASIREFFTHGFFLAGFLHADPHPGNFLFCKDRVAFLDFGRVTELTPQEARDFAEIYEATIDDDREKGREIFKRMNVVKDWSRFDFDAFWDVARSVHKQHLDRNETEMSPDFVRQAMEAMQRFPQKREIRNPGGFFWSNTVHIMTWHIFGSLRARANWHEESVKLIQRMPREGFLSRWND